MLMVKLTLVVWIWVALSYRLALAKFAVAVLFSHSFARLCDVIAALILAGHLLVTTFIGDLFKFQCATAGCCWDTIIKEVIYLRMALIILLCCCIVSLVPMHLRVLSSCYATLLFWLCGRSCVWSSLRLLMWRKSKVKFPTFDLFIRMQATDKTKQILALQGGRGCHDLAGIESCRVLTLVIGLLLGLFTFFCFDFSSLLSRCFRTIITDLIPEENLWTVNFSAVDKWICKNIGARVAPSLVPVWIPRVNITTVANASILA